MTSPFRSDFALRVFAASSLRVGSGTAAWRARACVETLIPRRNSSTSRWPVRASGKTEPRAKRIGAQMIARTPVMIANHKRREPPPMIVNRTAPGHFGEVASRLDTSSVQRALCKSRAGEVCGASPSSNRRGPGSCRARLAGGELAAAGELVRSRCADMKTLCARKVDAVLPSEAFIIISDRDALRRRPGIGDHLCK